MNNHIQEIKKKLGLDKLPNINPPEDYSSIQPEKWYYVQGDGGMLGKDVIAKKITMTRVITWYEYKQRQLRGKQMMEDEKRKREQWEQEYDIPF